MSDKFSSNVTVGIIAAIDNKGAFNIREDTTVIVVVVISLCHELRPLLNSSMPKKSIIIHGSTPMTILLSPDGSLLISPGPLSIIVPSSIMVLARPDRISEICAIWQLTVFS